MLTAIQLPWSTSNEDLVELFTTIGKVERAEIQYEPGGRSRGSGVVEFDTAENAETAICMCLRTPGRLAHANTAQQSSQATCTAAALSD
jgi:hypothetical protein